MTFFCVCTGALALACLQPDFVALVPGLGKAKLSPSFVISACASSLSRVRVALGLPAQCESRINCDAGVAPVRTLHLVGLNDLQYKPEAEANALDHFLHRDPNLGLVYLFPPHTHTHTHTRSESPLDTPFLLRSSVEGTQKMRGSFERARRASERHLGLSCVSDSLEFS